MGKNLSGIAVFTMGLAIIGGNAYFAIIDSGGVGRAGEIARAEALAQQAKDAANGMTAEVQVEKQPPLLEEAPALEERLETASSQLVVAAPDEVARISAELTTKEDDAEVIEEQPTTSIINEESDKTADNTYDASLDDAPVAQVEKAIADADAVAVIDEPTAAPLEDTATNIDIENTFEAITGNWVTKTNEISGNWRIFENETGFQTLEFDSNFATMETDGLKVMLSPLPVSELTSKNASQDALLVSNLFSITGLQTYDLGIIDLSNFQSIIIYTDEYAILWAAAEL